MERQHMLKADFLDILFEHRNKKYGAYELRINYSRRLRKALFFAVLLILIAVYVPFLASLKANANGDTKPPDVSRRIISNVKPITEPNPKSAESKTNKPTKNQDPRKNATQKQFTTQIIRTTQDIHDQDKLPSQSDMDKDLAGTTNSNDGNVSNPDSGNTYPSSDDDKQIPTSVPDKEDNKIYNVFDGGIEIYPEFPGGEDAMIRFIASHIKYPSKALENDIQGRVIVGFTVDKKGAITDIHLIKGIGFGCDEEAMRVIKIMPKWQAAQMNGKPVSVMYQIPIEYSIDN